MEYSGIDVQDTYRESQDVALKGVPRILYILFTI